jgi:hypothetical protein
MGMTDTPDEVFRKVSTITLVNALPEPIMVWCEVYGNERYTARYDPELDGWAVIDVESTEQIAFVRIHVFEEEE